MAPCPAGAAIHIALATALFVCSAAVVIDLRPGPPATGSCEVREPAVLEHAFAARASSNVCATAAAQRAAYGDGSPQHSTAQAACVLWQSIERSQAVAHESDCARARLLLVRYPREAVGLNAVLTYIASALMHAHARKRVLIMDERDRWAFGRSSLCDASSDNSTQLYCLIQRISVCNWWNSGAAALEHEGSVVRDLELFAWPALSSDADADEEDAASVNLRKWAPYYTVHSSVKHTRESHVRDANGTELNLRLRRVSSAGMVEWKGLTTHRVLRMTAEMSHVFYTDPVYWFASEYNRIPRGMDAHAYWAHFLRYVMRPSSALEAAVRERVKKGMHARGGSNSTCACAHLQPRQFVALHMRRGDKYTEYAIVDTDADMMAVAELTQRTGQHIVFIASDSTKAVVRAAAALSNVTVCALSDVHRVGMDRWGKAWGASLLAYYSYTRTFVSELIVDALSNVYVMSTAAGLAGAWHSNFAMASAALAFSRQDARVPFVWTDARTCATHQHPSAARESMFGMTPHHNAAVGWGGGHE